MRCQRCIPVALVLVLCCSLWAAPAHKSGDQKSSEHWVATWGTAQLMAPLVFRIPPNMRNQSAHSQPATTPQNSPASSATEQAKTAPPPRPRMGPLEQNKVPPKFEDETVRMIGRTSIGGKRVRIELSNMVTAEPLEIGAAHIAIHKSDGAIVEGSDRPLTFGGSTTFTIPSGALVVSDPVDLDLPALGEFAVSLYLPKDTGAPTNHFLGMHTAYISKGNVAGSVAMPNPSTSFAYLWLTSVDVIAPSKAYTVVAFGDSITDGYATTRDADRAWPFLLAKRLSANKRTQHVAVVNEGISGNQVLRDGAGTSAVSRLDRDVLTRPGVKWVILLEGINDINLRGRSDGPEAVTADELIWAYRQIVARCHQQNIKVIGATIMPEEGVPTASERGEAIRQAVNKWIRDKGNFDAVIDFDAVVRDPQRPVHLKAEYDPGDHIHPNDAGNQAMADAFDLSWFNN